jgi:hypothetical protein
MQSFLCVRAAVFLLAWAVFLLASRLTKRALMDNAPLWNKLARHHVVPHARAPTTRLLFSEEAACMCDVDVAHSYC